MLVSARQHSQFMLEYQKDEHQEKRAFFCGLPLTGLIKMEKLWEIILESKA